MSQLRAVTIGLVDPKDPSHVQRAILSIGQALPLPTLRVTIVAAAEDASSVRRITMRVIDRAGTARPGRYRLRVWIAATAFGAPGGTQVIAVVPGTTLLQTIASNQDLSLLTDPSGTAQLDVTVSGPGTRHVMADVAGEVVTSGAVAWT
ncbi:MAG: hypothetical protein SFZ23_08620 [Planctomycetota bacterium]|nr:hypothetical protein [Planctomycetota bacterium]